VFGPVFLILLQGSDVCAANQYAGIFIRQAYAERMGRGAGAPGTPGLPGFAIFPRRSRKPGVLFVNADPADGGIPYFVQRYREYRDKFLQARRSSLRKMQGIRDAAARWTGPRNFPNR
jgi:hypothetical protein